MSTHEWQYNNGNKQVIDLTSKCGTRGQNANILIDECSTTGKQYLYIDNVMMTSPIITTEVLDASTSIVHTENHAYLIPSMISYRRVSREDLHTLREELYDVLQV
jgi:hypothetical protein